MTVTLAALAVLLPFASAAVTLLTGSIAPGYTRPLAVLPTAASAVLTVICAAHVGGGHADAGTRLTPTGGVPIDLAVHLDGYATLTAVLVAVVATTVQVYSLGYLHGQPHYPSYAAIVSLFTSAMLLVVYSGDLMVLLVGWEVMGICSYLLIGHHFQTAQARSASLKAFLITKVGDVPFLFGLFALAADAGTFRINGVLTAATHHQLQHPTLDALLLLAGVVGKSAQFPLHTWLPDAMAGPTPVSALIHAATMVAAGAYLVARLHPVFLASGAALLVLALIAAVTMLGSALCALAQDDIKRVLAYSTIGQLGYLTGALAVANRDAAEFHLLTHGAFKALLFLAAGTLSYTAGSTSLTTMSSTPGLRRRAPDAFVTLTVGLAALAGLPPFSGFFSKESVLAAAEHATSGHGTALTAAGWTVLLAGLLTALLTACYATRVWLLAAGSPGDQDSDNAGGATPTPSEPRGTTGRATAPEPATMRWPLWALAAPALALGLAGLNQHWLPALLDGHTLRPTLTTAAVGTAVALLGIALGYGTWARGHIAAGTDPIAGLLGPLRSPARHGFHLDVAYRTAIILPVRAASRLTRHLDREVIETYVRGTTAGTRLLGTAARRAQTGNAQTYLSALLGGALLIAILVVITP